MVSARALWSRLACLLVICSLSISVTTLAALDLRRGTLPDDFPDYEHNPADPETTCQNRTARLNGTPVDYIYPCNYSEAFPLEVGCPPNQYVVCWLEGHSTGKIIQPRQPDFDFDRNKKYADQTGTQKRRAELIWHYIHQRMNISCCNISSSSYDCGCRIPVTFVPCTEVMDDETPSTIVPTVRVATVSGTDSTTAVFPVTSATTNGLEEVPEEKPTRMSGGMIALIVGGTLVLCLAGPTVCCYCSRNPPPPAYDAQDTNENDRSNPNLHLSVLSNHGNSNVAINGTDNHPVQNNANNVNKAVHQLPSDESAQQAQRLLSSNGESAL